MSKFISDIRQARKEGRLPQRFFPKDVQYACPGWAEKTYYVFLTKHRLDNPGRYKAYFERRSDGSYSLIDESK